MVPETLQELFLAQLDVLDILPFLIRLPGSASARFWQTT
jgi:hypothetical protein